jgi:hypothetical protein
MEVVFSYCSKSDEVFFMDSLTNCKCWEILNCDNLTCLARQEPETPCWEIAKRVEDYRSISNTCRDCIIYLSKESAPYSSKHKINNIIFKRGRLSGKYLSRKFCCDLKTHAAF